MKILATGITVTFLASGCLGISHVDFAYFNLSGTEIYVTQIDGFPPNATPGVLMSVHDGNNKREAKAAHFFENVHIGERIAIQWQEGATSHEVQLKREEVGLPRELMRGEIQLTYLGEDRWRVKIVH
jgi:hypothetical protein